MSSRSSEPASRQVTMARCLMALTIAVALLCAGTAKAANYRLVLCAGNNGSNQYDTATNTTSAQNPGGIFEFTNACGPAPYPAGNNALLRIAENQASGNAGYGAYGSISWTVPPWIAILAGGGYTREPGSFNDGWRGRFWAEGFDGSGPYNILMQGAGAPNSGIEWAPTSTFASHLWPFPSYGYYKRFVFELTCFRQAGCDRTGLNAVDANTINLVLADVSPAQVSLGDGASPVLAGGWSRGSERIGWSSSDQGSGMRFERLRVDGNLLSFVDYRSRCDIDWNQAVGEFARSFTPCPQGANSGSYQLETASLPDGAHTVSLCAQDYAQSAGLDGSGGESCDQRTIRTDNTPPGAPAGLEVTSANPHRYLQHFGAGWQLPPNQGSPIAKVHYEVLDAAGKAVVPERTLAATNPTSLSGIEGPAKAGDYRLRVWLEDEVGFTGPAAVAQIPHDTVPPAAPQELTAIGPASYGPAQGYQLRWRDVTDEGSPIIAAHYQVLDSAGTVVEPTKTVSGENVASLAELEVPRQTGDYSVKVWLEDEEGNVGAAASAPLPRDTTPPAAPQGLSVAAPSTPRSSEGFDLRWRNVADGGSPITVAHYTVLNGAGKVVVPTQDVRGKNIEGIEDLVVPRDAGEYTLRLWLGDEEGNVGAAVTAPLSYDCVRSDVAGGTKLSAGFGPGLSSQTTVAEGEGATLAGKLQGADGAGAAICVFGRVLTDQGREFLGVAMTNPDGEYRFAIGSGPSRELTAAYRPDQRELSASAELRTQVHPRFELKQPVVHNKGYAVFTGSIPGPHNESVLVVLQVRSGKHWRVFRRYETRAGGEFVMRYHFTRTPIATTYAMRAQVRPQDAYPYEAGNSAVRRLRVVPR